MAFQKTLKILTPGRGMQDITANVVEMVAEANVAFGLCHVFLHHTSASLIISENSDQAVQADLETFMQKWVIDGDKSFQHDAEGPDDMPSHIRSILTGVSLTIPISQHRLLLGTWQGIFLWEHRYKSNQRKLTITILS